MRLDQFLSARTMYSRRELRQMIQKGKATVDGAVVRKADQHVQPDENTVCLNGRHIPGDQYLYVLLHKPKGYVSSAAGRTCDLWDGWTKTLPGCCCSPMTGSWRTRSLRHGVTWRNTITSCWLAPRRTAMRKRWQRAWCWRMAHSVCRQRLPRWRAQTVRR